mgnify:CR=1 FL=1|tara:strand:+ start:24 stop:419 length:396 start_codon:yes stop_codon:yes gene_type:complete
MPFKLGGERREIKSSDNVNLSSNRKGKVNTSSDLGEGVLARANMDGSIDVSPDVNKDSQEFQTVMKHEMKHIEQMEQEKAAYGDGWVMWEGKIYMRREEKGEPIIDGPNGKWPEGHPNHPWEAEAIAAENQ